MSLIQNLIGTVIGDQIAVQIAKATGLSEEQTKKAVAIAMPLLLSGLAKNSTKPEGAASLDKALEKHDGSIFDHLDISSLLGSDDGTKITNHILGSKTQQAEDTIAKETGADSSQIANIMKIAGPLLMGAVGKEKKSQGLDLAGLTGLLSNEKKTTQSDSGMMGMISNLIDQNDDGSIVDDLMGFAANMMKK